MPPSFQLPSEGGGCEDGGLSFSASLFSFFSKSLFGYDEMASRARTILNLLYAGETVEVFFSSFSARENFRTALYDLKKREDLSMEVLLEEEKKVLSFSSFIKEDEPNGEIYAARLSLKKQRGGGFSFRVISQTENDKA